MGFLVGGEEAKWGYNSVGFQAQKKESG